MLWSVDVDAHIVIAIVLVLDVDVPSYFPIWHQTPRPLSEGPPLKAVSANPMPANLKTARERL